MLVEQLVSASGKLLLAGDLNFHVNDPSEGNAYQFLAIEQESSSYVKETEQHEY